MPEKENNKTIRLAALGDLLFPIDPAGRDRPRDPAEAMRGLQALLGGCEVVFGNPECTLPARRMVSTEPRILAEEDQIRSLARAGLTIVTLANNHTFDAYEEGFARLCRLLEENHLTWFGAGDDIDSAMRPAVVEAGGLRLGFLGAVDAVSGPAQVAGAGRAGVAPLEMPLLIERIEALRGQVDHVIVAPHWGRERFDFPSPRQVAQARAMIDAGASLVIAHHPHVLQGLERYRDGYIAYSLGNLLASEVPFTDGGRVTWNRTERTGCVLLADLTARQVVAVRQVPTFDDGQEVRIDYSALARQRIRRVNRAVASPITPARYARERFRVEVLRPVLKHLRRPPIRKLLSLRPGRVWRALRRPAAPR